MKKYPFLLLPETANVSIFVEIQGLLSRKDWLPPFFFVLILLVPKKGPKKFVFSKHPYLIRYIVDFVFRWTRPSDHWPLPAHGNETKHDFDSVTRSLI